MAKLVASDGGVKGVDIKTERGIRKYNVNKSGTIEVDNPRHAKQMLAEGFFQASLMGISPVGKGYPCNSCGFGAWFKVCSRCGHDNG